LPELRPFAAAAGVDGIAVGIQILIKRLHENGRLKASMKGARSSKSGAL
jgi:hypothetical protein